MLVFTKVYGISSRVDTRITFWNYCEKRDSLFRPKILVRLASQN
jgi:hypothetical protein